MELRVATFNLRNFTAEDGDDRWERRVDQVAAMFRATGAVVVGTQEGYHAMLQDLAARLPEFRWTGLGRSGNLEDEFCAVFHRPDAVSPVASGHFWLSETPEVAGSRSWGSSVPRMCTWVRLRLGPGPELLVFNTHLDHRSAEARLEGIRVICRTIAESRRALGLPALLLGDLNATPDSPVVSFLRSGPGLVDAFTALAPAAPGGTFHGFRGGDAGGTIDYIFGTPDLAFSATEVYRNRIDGRYPSDHYPVAATVHLPEA